jgi:hypothetical protein
LFLFHLLVSQTHSNSNLVQINREKKFSLNLEKTLEKKILATNREVQFEYHQTGGGIVGNADAITYELVKNAIAYYYVNMINSTRRVEITKDNDKKGLNLSTVFKVYDEDKHQYTLTLQGRIQGGAHPARAPLKLEENIIFWRKIVIFHTKYLPPLAAIFLSATSLFVARIFFSSVFSKLRENFFSLFI